MSNTGVQYVHDMHAMATDSQLERRHAESLQTRSPTLKTKCLAKDLRLGPVHVPRYIIHVELDTECMMDTQSPTAEESGIRTLVFSFWVR